RINHNKTDSTLHMFIISPFAEFSMMQTILSEVEEDEEEEEDLPKINVIDIHVGLPMPHIDDKKTHELETTNITSIRLRVKKLGVVDPDDIALPPFVNLLDNLLLRCI
ncbi:hypothetical protein ACJX0J_007475, partial [Zea mays]